MECFHGGSGYWSYIMCAFVESVCEQYLGSTSGCISIFKYDALLVSFPGSFHMQLHSWVGPENKTTVLQCYSM